MSNERPNYGVAVSGHETDDHWAGITLDDWLDRFRQNASTSPDGSPRIVHRQRQEADRTAEAFPFVSRAER